jgi:hypothetical protein
MPLVLNGTTGVQDNSGAFVAGTAVASTSGTSIDFTSIPSWVKRVTVIFNEVSTNGTSIVQVQLGSTTFTTSGYVSSAQQASVVQSSTTGIVVSPFNAAADIRIGAVTVTNALVFDRGLKLSRQ